MPAAIHHLTPPAPTVQGKLRERLRQYDDARIEVAACQRERHDLIRRLAQGNVSGITQARIHAVTTKLDNAIALQGEIEGILLDAASHRDMNDAEDRVMAMYEALDRLEAGDSSSDEHRLTSHDLGISARAR